MTSDLDNYPPEVRDKILAWQCQDASRLLLSPEESLREIKQEEFEDKSEEDKKNIISEQTKAITEKEKKVRAVRDVVLKIIKDNELNEDEIDFILKLKDEIAAPSKTRAGNDGKAKKQANRDKGKNILIIDRSQPFDPTQFKGLEDNWSIWRGPANGKGLSGEEDQDKNSLALDEIDLNNIELVTMLRNGEASIKGEEKLNRLKDSNYIRLDAKIFETLWDNKHLIPEKWKEKINGNIQYIFFDGTILRGPNGRRCVLYIYWGDGGWGWHYGWLDDDWVVHDPSAVLAST